VFVTVIKYVITSPTESYGPDDVAVLTTLSAGLCCSGTDAESLDGPVWSLSAVVVLV
jgi:hypothetical protein